ncbi:NAD(P)-dependent oxidoreductase [Microlunatus sp. Gsoil 973]|uniref:NAD-dependent epimerase/dehydratase family protein n=1 Tax=Microlunatus sp. Gsoil 973 TaxID=2672569 RepID=UPI0012B4D2E6|nr:NAD(P)-dependent oxidoreductase [Microlunatus sp. Gsoil 973]QGN31583.1 NAD-dependent epimerase/dehydratase family protein [Microlunatus sp. Gsoil 973]
MSDNAGMKVLVTGAAGRLGSFVVPALVDAGYRVVGTDRFPYPEGSPNAELAVPFVQADLTDIGDCFRAITMAQPDMIVSLGAIPFNTELHPPYAKDYDTEYEETGARFVQRLPEDETFRVNTMGTYYLLDAARRVGGVRRIIHASSFFVLGLGFRLSGTPYIPPYLPMDEDTPLEPEDSYSLSKVIGEEILKAYSRAYGIETVALRLLGVYYHNVEMSRRMHTFDIDVPEVDDVAKGYPNNTTYQYADARDIADFILLAMTAQLKNSFEPYFVATDVRYRHSTQDALKRRWPLLVERGLGGGIEGDEPLISIEKARRELGYEPSYSWRNDL